MTETSELRRSTVPKPADREEWLDVRRPFFNASDAAVLFDEHPYRTAGDVATLKLTASEQAQTRPMIRGQRLEDVIGKWWADEHDCELYEPAQLYVAGRMMATVDRMVDLGPTQFIGLPVEIKTANTFAPEPQRYWLYQCQAIMFCTGKPRCILVWFDSTMDLQWRELEADSKIQGHLLTGSERFMAAIDMRMVPDWVRLSYTNLSDLYPAAKRPSIELDDDGFNMVVALRTVRAARMAAEREEERIKAEIGAVLGDHEAGLYAGREVIRWSNVKGSKQLDGKRLAAEHPDVAADYWVTRPGTRRMIPVGDDEEAA